MRPNNRPVGYEHSKNILGENWVNAFVKLFFILSCHLRIQEVIKMVVLPDKPAVVALIDSEKVNLFLIAVIPI